MDLSIIVGDTKLKIRVAGLLSTPKGFLFEKSDKEYIFTIGGKVMINETSEEAIKREVMEEIGMQVNSVKLCSIIENLYSKGDEKIHEICFVYKIESVFEGSVPDGFVEVPLENIDKYEIKPIYIVDILKEQTANFRHFIIS